VQPDVCKLVRNPHNILHAAAPDDPGQLTPTCRPQITSEQIVREAKELQEKDFKPPTQLITNEVELGEYRLRKRKEYEDTLRMKRWNLNVWRNVSR